MYDRTVPFATVPCQLRQTVLNVALAGLEELSCKEGESVLEVGFGTGHAIVEMCKVRTHEFADI